MDALVQLSEFAAAGVRVEQGWQQCSAPDGSYPAPADVPSEVWRESNGSTVCAQLRDTGQLTREPAPDVDGQEHWYRIQIAASEWPDLPDTRLNAETDSAAGAVSPRHLLVFDGLATLCSVWFNGQHVLESESMYQRFALDVTTLVSDKNELVIRFHALLPALRKKKGPRRWPTRLVNERNLRFVRTTLLGRMPGWTPPWPAVGPFRPVRLVTLAGCLLERVQCLPDVDAQGPYLDLQIDARFDNAAPLDGEALSATLEVAGTRESFPLQLTAERARGKQRIRVPNAEQWWPHTHGSPTLYPARLTLRCGAQQFCYSLGKIGFRHVHLLPPEDFGFQVNGVDIFCRGGCWAPLDVVTLSSTPEALRTALQQVQHGGMNMLRISGTLLYEAPEFHALCDELGILVWQDFMFANMDYPRQDAAFDALVHQEAAQLLERLGPRCSTALLCGGSEIEQQAAMMGLPSDQWQHPLWREQLPALVRQWCGSVPYWYGSPGGDGLPFWPHHGCTHYYGVGAYLRPFPDARAAGVRFASECLALANPPDLATDTPETALRVPQDNGASWSFADVTRHYVTELFRINGRELEQAEPVHYAALARRASAYVMHQVQTHFRDPVTPCRGALVWMLRDLEAGWGWGIVDVNGHAKSGYHALSQVWAPRAVWLVDEGLSGLSVVIANDPNRVLEAELVLELLHENGTVIDKLSRPVQLLPHTSLRLRVEELLGRFIDASDAYRFGPPAFDRLRVALLLDGQCISEEQRIIGRASALNGAREATSSEGQLSS